MRTACLGFSETSAYLACQGFPRHVSDSVTLSMLPPTSLCSVCTHVLCACVCVCILTFHLHLRLRLQRGESGRLKEGNLRGITRPCLGAGCDAGAPVAAMRRAWQVYTPPLRSDIRPPAFLRFSLVVVPTSAGL